MKKIVVPIVIAAVVAGAVFFYIKVLNRAGDGDVIKISGNIETTEAELGFKIPGKLLERRVSEGDVVKPGEVLGVLESADVEKEVAVREADVQTAEAALADLEAGARPEEISRAAEAVRKRDRPSR